MKQVLSEVIKITKPLGFEFIKLSNNHDENGTLIQAISPDSCVVFKAITKKKIEGFDGVMALPNVNLLSGLLDLYSSKEAKASVKNRNIEDEAVAEEIVFEMPGHSKSSYRLLNRNLIPPKMQTTLNVSSWNVVVENPPRRKIAEFIKLAGTYSSFSENKFSVKTENGNLVFVIGIDNEVSNKAVYVFDNGVNGEISPRWYWKIQNILSVMNNIDNIDGIYRFSDLGIISMSASTDLAEYNFYFKPLEEITF